MAVLDRGELIAYGRPADLADELWDGLEVEVDLGARPGPEVVEAARRQPGVLDAVPDAAGLRLRVEGREVVPRVVGALVAAGAEVFAAVPRPPTLEDVYFAIEARRAAEAGLAPEVPA